MRSPRAFQEITLCPPAPSLGSLHSAAAAPSSVPAEPLSTATVVVSSSSGLDAGTTGYMLQGTDVAEHLMRRTVTPAQDSIIASSSARAPTTLAGLRQLSLELVRSNMAEGSDSIRSVRNLWGIMRPRKRIPGFSSIRSIGELWVLQWLAPILRPRNTGNFSYISYSILFHPTRVFQLMNQTNNCSSIYSLGCGVLGAKSRRRGI